MQFDNKSSVGKRYDISVLCLSIHLRAFLCMFSDIVTRVYSFCANLLVRFFAVLVKKRQLCCAANELQEWQQHIFYAGSVILQAAV